MNKSVSATQLSKMVYCEASVKSNPRLTQHDKALIEKGNEEHRKFESIIKAHTNNKVPTPLSPLGNTVNPNTKSHGKAPSLTPKLIIVTILIGLIAWAYLS